VKRFFVVSDDASECPAQLEISPGSGVVYIDTTWVNFEEGGGAPVFLVYSRKQAVRAALALLYCVVKSFGRPR